MFTTIRVVVFVQAFFGRFGRVTVDVFLIGRTVFVIQVRSPAVVSTWSTLLRIGIRRSVFLQGGISDVLWFADRAKIGVFQ